MDLEPSLDSGSWSLSLGAGKIRLFNNYYGVFIIRNFSDFRENLLVQTVSIQVSFIKAVNKWE
jgi:hypothetical protein